MAPIDPRIPRRALVTGAGRRIGRAIALALAGAGFDVLVHHHASAADAARTVADCRALGVQAQAVAADLTIEAQVQALAAEAGVLGILVNNASPFVRDEWHDATRDGWDLHVESILRAPFVLTQGLARALPEEAHGVVVNMLDQRVWSLTPHFVSYTVAKAGLWALTQSMALALAPRVRVVGVGPGPALANERQSPEQFARQAASVPLGHGTSPEEIAHAVLALLALPSVTGQMLALDGGQHLQWGRDRD